MTGLGEFAAVCAAVLSDYRVILIAAATIFAWAALRYVGMVYTRRSPRRRPAGRAGGPRPKSGGERRAAP